MSQNEPEPEKKTRNIYRNILSNDRSERHKQLESSQLTN
jgi:hypothetical protein